jgi:hypothetical protein
MHRVTFTVTIVGIHVVGVAILGISDSHWASGDPSQNHPIGLIPFISEINLVGAVRRKEIGLLVSLFAIGFVVTAVTSGWPGFSKLRSDSSAPSQAWSVLARSPVPAQSMNMPVAHDSQIAPNSATINAATPADQTDTEDADAPPPIPDADRPVPVSFALRHGNGHGIGAHRAAIVIDSDNRPLTITVVHVLGSGGQSEQASFSLEPAKPMSLDDAGWTLQPGDRLIAQSSPFHDVEFSVP